MISVTQICNAALGKIGAKRINDYTEDSSVQAIQCRTHYEHTRDALLRSHFWRFASDRAELTEDAEEPAFEWDSQFILPNDFLRLKSVYEDNNTAGDSTRQSFAIEGQRILTNESTCQIRYIKKVTDPTKFDPLFTEVLILQLALKFIGPLAGGDPKLQDIVQRELDALMPAVRALDRQETNTTGRHDRYTWTDVRATRGGRIDSKLGSN